MTDLAKEITRITVEMKTLEVGSAYYEKLLEDLKKLHEMEIKERQLALETEKTIADKKFKPDWNMLVSGAISLASILLVLNYEKTDIITSKSWNIAGKMIGKGK